MAKEIDLENASMLEKLDIFILLMHKKCPPENKEVVEELLRELVRLKRDLIIVRDELKSTKILVAEGVLSMMDRAQKIKDCISYHRSLSIEISEIVSEVQSYVH